MKNIKSGAHKDQKDQVKIKNFDMIKKITSKRKIHGPSKKYL